MHLKIKRKYLRPATLIINNPPVGFSAVYGGFSHNFIGHKIYNSILLLRYFFVRPFGWFLVFLLVAAFLPVKNVLAQQDPITLINCTVYTMTNRGILENALLRVSDGTVEEITVNTSSDSIMDRTVDLGGAFVLPGLIDPHSIYNPQSSPRDQLEPPSIFQNLSLTDEAIYSALKEGITTIALRPPADSLISGYSVLVDLLPDSLGGPSIEKDTLDLQISIAGPMHSNLSSEERDANRMNRLYHFRDAIRDIGESHPANFIRTRKTNAVERAVRQRIPLYIVADDAMGLIQVRKAIRSLDIPSYFGRVHEVVEAIHGSGNLFSSGGIRDFILGPVLFTIDPESNRYYSIPSRMSELGFRYAIGTFHPFPPTTSLLDQARELAQYGVTELEALGALTVIPGRTLNPGTKLGTIAPGAVANFVVLDKPPMDVSGKIVLTVVNGHLLWNEK